MSVLPEVLEQGILRNGQHPLPIPDNGEKARMEPNLPGDHARCVEFSGLLGWEIWG